MNFRRPDIPIEIVTSMALAAVILMIAAWTGMLTAKLSNAYGDRIFYYVAVFSLLMMGGIVVVTRREPLRFAFLALIVCFPIVGTVVPPGRIGFSIFDVVMIALTIGLIRPKVLASSNASGPLFPTTSLQIVWLMLIPSVVLSQFPLLSLQRFIEMFAIYAFFLYALSELKRTGGAARLVLLLSIVTIFMAIGIFFEHFTHVVPRMGSQHINQIGRSAGIKIYRTSGFFFDPQGAGAFLSSIIAFFVVLCIRSWSTSLKMRVMLWIAITLGSIALIMTFSRGAILSCLIVTIIVLFLFNPWKFAVKLIFTGSVAVLVLVLSLFPVDAWQFMLPAALTERLYTTREAFEGRLMIWFDTWDMFTDHPVTGIGFGSFQQYLIKTRPGLFNFYGIGTAQGIAYIPNQAENGYLTILYEGGVVGSIAALLAVADALRRMIGVIASRSDPEARTECIASLAGLLTFGATFMTLFTTGDERVAGIFAFLLAIIWHRSVQSGHVVPKA